MVSFINQFVVISRVLGPTFNPATSPSATAATELTNEVNWIISASGY